MHKRLALRDDFFCGPVQSASRPVSNVSYKMACAWSCRPQPLLNNFDLAAHVNLHCPRQFFNLLHHFEPENATGRQP
jgi:hypothetical protein